jgi:cytoskeleton protein RodZ
VTAILLVLGLIARPERRPAARPDKPTARAARVELKNVAVSSEPTPVVQQEEPAALPAPESEQLVSLLLEFDADSWTKLDAAGQTLLEGLVRRGETRRFEARGGFRLTLGNAGGVRVTIDGHALESLGRTGQVIRDFRLPAPSARG